jgi:AcrR family transcriptional regulator
MDGPAMIRRTSPGRVRQEEGSETGGSAPPVVGRRERRKLAIRAAVREAALRLSLRHGVENVTVEQIAAEADIALRTFFNHFSSKEEAVVAAVAAGAEALIAEFRARPRTESVLRALREAVLVVMDQSDAASRDHVEALRLVRRAPSLRPQQLAVLAAQEKALADAIADRVDPAAGSSPVYPQLCAAAALAALRVVLDRWLDRSADPADPPQMDVLRSEIDQAIGELAAGLDRY